MKPTLIALTILCCGQLLAAEKKPLKVFILAGQSNMEGPASVKTFDYIGDDPATVSTKQQRLRAANRIK
jgi:Carbohydrate esterase, sialic acid-specific acetylesterase